MWARQEAQTHWQKDLPPAAEANEVALSPAAANPGASSLKAPETETAAASGAALAAPLATKPSPKKAVSFKEDKLPPADPTLADTPAAAEEEGINHTDATAEAIPTTATPTHAAEERGTVPGSILLTPIQETNLTKTDESLGETAAAEPDYLSSAEISEMPGIGKSIPGTPETEAGSVLVGGSEEPKALSIPEKQMVESHEDTSPLSQIQRKHENAEERVSCKPVHINEFRDKRFEAFDCLADIKPAAPSSIVHANLSQCDYLCVHLQSSEKASHQRLEQGL